mgnify:CR=1 FL=1
MKYRVMIEPFDEGFEYVCETNENGSWKTNNNPKTYNTKEDAEEAAKKWNTGIVVKYEGEIL